jgi:hypothetical protein
MKNRPFRMEQFEKIRRYGRWGKQRMATLNAYQKRMMANTEKIEQEPGMMQSMEEHQDIPTEDATAAKPLNERRKRNRGWKSTAGRRGEPKELT